MSDRPTVDPPGSGNTGQSPALQPEQPAGSPRRLRLPPLLAFVLRRLLLSIPVLFGVTFICYGILSAAPGDPVRIIMGQHYDPVIAEQIRKSWGLDQPWLVQYSRFLWRTAHGDLGHSYAKRTAVGPFILDKFGNTLQLTLVAMTIAIVFGMSAGIVSAAWPRSPADAALMILAVAGISIPVFWLGMLLQVSFAAKLGWLPVSDMSYSGDLTTLWKSSGSYPAFWWQAYGRYFVLPGLTLGTVPMAIIARLTRSSMLEVLNQDYIRTARAKGLSWPRVVLTHALPNALIPVITVIGNNFAALLTGAVLTETVFAWPGLGRVMVEAISQFDYPVVMGGVILMACVFVLINLLVDITYGLIDPRVRAA